MITVASLALDKRLAGPGYASAPCDTGFGVSRWRIHCRGETCLARAAPGDAPTTIGDLLPKSGPSHADCVASVPRAGEREPSLAVQSAHFQQPRRKALSWRFSGNPHESPSLVALGVAAGMGRVG